MKILRFIMSISTSGDTWERYRVRVGREISSPLLGFKTQSVRKYKDKTQDFKINSLYYDMYREKFNTKTSCKKI